MPYESYMVGLTISYAKNLVVVTDNTNISPKGNRSSAESRELIEEIGMNRAAAGMKKVS